MECNKWPHHKTKAKFKFNSETKPPVFPTLWSWQKHNNNNKKKVGLKDWRGKKLKITLSTLKYLWFNCPHVSCLTSMDSLNLTPYTAYKTYTGMKDYFALFPHFTRSDATKQYTGPTTDTHTHTHTHTNPLQIWPLKDGNQSLEKTMLLVKSILDF